MTTCTIEAGTLTANLTDRIVSGLLLPFGEVGKTNLGKFTVDAGVITIPADVTVLAANTEHSRENPVARFMTATETAAGIVATFLVGKNPDGDALLAEIASDATDARRKLSAEVANVVIRAGRAVSGTLFGAAFVSSGAFPSAALMATAADTEQTVEPTTPPAAPKPAPPRPTTSTETTRATVTGADGVERVEVTTRTTVTDGLRTTVTESTEIESPTPPTAPEGDTTVTIPNTLTAAAATGPKPMTLVEIGAMLYACKQGTLSFDEVSAQLAGQNGDTLFGVLNDVKYDGVGGLAPSMMLLPQWIGMLWQALNYRQQVLPLFSHANLTSLTLNGFKWTTKPAGGDWAGNKAPVPSNTLVVTPVTGNATRYAAGHDIAREFVDFPVPGFFESYAAAVTEDYARWADAKVATAVLAGATALVADPLAGLPGTTGGTIGSAASAIVDGATALVVNGVLPTFALLAPALWKQLIKAPRSNVLGYLNAALGLAEGDLAGFIIRPSATVAAGKVLVGAKEAATVYELPGAPIRIDALDLVKGGVDKAAFGYAGVVVNDAAGLQLVTAAI